MTVGPLEEWIGGSLPRGIAQNGAGARHKLGTALPASYRRA
ncbi:MAG TPA: hypothetical protein VJ817_14400 [Gemmatimonadales bacterium]|nr:hypothetical protein [Gemmatimonadales bacterium]